MTKQSRRKFIAGFQAKVVSVCMTGAYSIRYPEVKASLYLKKLRLNLIFWT